MELVQGCPPYLYKKKDSIHFYNNKAPTTSVDFFLAILPFIYLSNVLFLCKYLGQDS